MARLGLATRDELLGWPSVVSAGEFPRLIRRLVWETVPDAVRLGFPAGSGTSAGDWDGSVRTITGNGFVPAGLSVWELSVQKTGITAKADDDYEKRTSTPDGSPTKDAEYVEAILRPWTTRRTWATGKRGDGRWKNVRGYGVDDIEEWLESAPVTHAWISELLGLAPYGYQAAETWWAGWARATNPMLPSSVLVAGRDEAVIALERRLDSGPGITTIRGSSVEEIRAFVAGLLDRQATAGDTRWRSRAAFVDQVTSWRALAARPDPLILVPASDEVAAEASQGAAHHIVIPVTAPSADIELPPVDARTAVAALRDAGLGEGQAEEAGRLGRRSLLSMRRALAVRPELHTPAWAANPSRTLRGLLLAGRWNQDQDADRTAVIDLTGGDYDTLQEELADLRRANDPFISQIGPAWMLVSIQDAWLQLCATVREDDLDRLEPVVRRVLLERDPALDLALDDRWYAATVGKSRAHSGELRHGLAATLAMLGTHGDAIDVGHGSSGAQWTSHIVHELLREANQDATGDTWNSLADVLQRLAEAAPDAFLDGLRDAATPPTPVIVTMFTDSAPATPTTETSRHYHLLRALERLAWSPEHFGRVIDLLARLTEIDPGGHLRHRPFSSLVTIFSLQYPETSVPASRRLAVLDTLRQRHLDTAWQLMMALLPSQLMAHDPTASPEFRDWKPQEPITVTPAEWVSSVETLIGWLVHDAGDDPQRWQQLLQALPFLPESSRQTFREELAARAGAGTLMDEGRADLRESLRALIAYQRSRPDGQRALLAGELDALHDIDRALVPADPVQRYGWLFARQRPELGDGPRFNDPGYETALREQQTAAVAATDEHGLDAVRELAAGAVDARIVGSCLAEASGDQHRAELVAMIPAPLADEGLAEGWLAHRFQQDGWTWLDGLLTENLTPVQTAVALLASHDYPKAWQTADTCGTPVAQAFWQYFSITGLGHGFSHAYEAAERLAQAGRVSAALKLAVIYLDDLGGEATDCLIDLLRQFAGAYQSDQEVGLLTEYDFRSIFEYLDQHTGPERNTDMGQLEWLFLGVLGFEPSANRLYQELAADPEFFVQILEVAWPEPEADPDEPTDQDNNPAPEDEPLTEEQRQQSSNAFMLLTSFDRLPGLAPDGRVDPAALQQWVNQVLELAAGSGRRRAAEALVGQILASAPLADDGTWPCEPVRDLLEELQSETAEQSLVIRLYNIRGVTARDPEAGGNQERTLAGRYRDEATALADRWPQTAAVLRNLAGMYETDARQHESWAERFRQGQQR
jgi:hypothetical protein